ncbi:MAG: hypothetical protein ACPF8V_10000 [Luteibaculum sp.]
MKKSLSLLLGALLVSFSFSAFSKTFEAKSNGAWASSSTWKGGSVPEADDDVIISGFAITISINNAVCKSLLIDDTNSGSTSLTINNGGNLNVSGLTTVMVNQGIGSTGAVLDILGTLNANGGVTMMNTSSQALNLVLGSTAQVNIGSQTLAGTLNTTSIFMRNVQAPLSILNPLDVNTIQLRNGSLSISQGITMGELESTSNNFYNSLTVNDAGIYKGTTKRIFYGASTPVNIIQGRFLVSGLDANTKYEFIYNGSSNQSLRFNKIVYQDVIVQKPSGILFVDENLASATTIRRLTVKTGSTLGINKLNANIDALSTAGSFVLESNARLQISGQGFASGIPSKTASSVSNTAIVEYLVTDGQQQEIFRESYFYPIVELTGSGTKFFGTGSVAINNSATTLQRINLLQGTFLIDPSRTLQLNTAGTEGIIDLRANTTLNLAGNFTALNAAWLIDRNNTFRYSSSSEQTILNPLRKDGTKAAYGILDLVKSTSGQAIRRLPATRSIDVANRLLINANVNLILDQGSEIRMLSNQTFTAFVGQVSSASSITYNGTPAGRFTIQKYLPLPYRVNRDVTSPIKNTTLKSWLDKGVNMRGFPGSTSPTAGKPTVARYNERVKGNLNLGFENATNITNAIRLFDGDRTEQSVWRILDGNNANLQYAVTLEDQGEIYTGDQKFKINFTYTNGGGLNSKLYDDGWNLLGNPYAAVLDWDDVANDPANIGLFQSGRVDPTVYILSQIDRQTADPNNPGFYGFYNTSTGFKIVHDDLIPSYQGFWVKAFNPQDRDTTYTITVKESHKSNLEGSRFFKNNDLRNGKAIDPETEAVEISIIEGYENS